MDFVDLQREFRDLSDDEQSGRVPIYFRDSRFHKGTHWEEILQSRRVVVCAEAGAGKTAELQGCQRQLSQKNRFAFFIPIEAICIRQLEAYLEAESIASEPTLDRFKAWRDKSDDTAWFFLDSLDEAKLAKHTLGEALQSVTVAIGKSALPRARFVVSSRPNWNPIDDRRLLDKYVPPHVAKTINEEDDFLQSIREPSSSNKSDEKVVAEIRVVALLSLTSNQQKNLATACGVSDVDGFINALNKTDIGSDERTPQDIIDLSAIWKSQKRLGTRREMLEQRIRTRLTEKSSSPYRIDDVLPYDKAVEGAQRLALALTMQRKRTIFTATQSQTSQETNDSVSCDNVLSDWSAQQIKSLLDRGLFLPASYGRVRFDHRSTEEYLAGQCLIHLCRSGGMSKRQLRNVFFDERYGERVVIPSKIPVAAWVALDDYCGVVRDELLRREPEVLVLHGDSASLPLSEQERLVRCYVQVYSQTQGDRLSLSIGELRRLATNDMTGVISECLSKPGLTENPLLFLLKLIWLGGLTDCVELIRPYFFDTAQDDYVRMIAIRAARSCNATDLMKSIIDSAVTDATSWSIALIRTVIEECVPSQFNINDFQKLIERCACGKKELDRLQSSIEEVCSVVPKRELAALISLFCKLIVSTKSGASKWELSSANAFLVAPLIQLCNRAFEEAPQTESLLKACSIAFDYSPRNVSLDDKEKGTLRVHIANASPEYRQILFWCEYEVALAWEPAADSWNLYCDLAHDSILRPYTQNDFTWIDNSVADEKRTSKEREITLRFWFALWTQDGKSSDALTKLQVSIQNSNTLQELLAELMRPPATEQVDEWEKKDRARRQRDERKQQTNEAEWVEFKEKLVASPEEHFKEENRKATVNSICIWLRHRPRDRDSSLGLNSWRDVRKHFGDTVANRFEQALRAHWRTTPRKLRSTICDEAHRMIDQDLVNGLTGLLIESAPKGWATNLTPDQAKIAAEWATLELNSFPDWFDALASAHESVVCSVLQSELKHETESFAPGEYPQILSMIKRGPESIQKAVAPQVFEAVQSWTPNRDSTPPHPGHTYAAMLQNLVEVLVQVDFRKSELRALGETNYPQSPTTEEGLIWLRAVAATDLLRVVPLVWPVIEKLIGNERQQYGYKVIAMLFGRRDYARIRASLDVDPSVLVGLVRFAYELVPPSRDPHHEGSYSPNVHDDAVQGRGILLGALANTQGEATYKALRSFVNDNLFEDRSHYLNKLAQERAANDSEWLVHSSDEFKQWLSRFEAYPKNMEQLFRLVAERLDDIQDELRDHDFSLRPLLINEEKEEHFQLFLADRLLKDSHDAYLVIREEEVVNKKKPDVRIAAKAFDGRVTIELKVGDSNTVATLETALEKQLSGKYLRDKRCKAGYLFITYGGRKGFLHPATSKDMTFQEVKDHLREKAKTLSCASGNEKLIDVVCLDLRSTPASKRNE